MTESAQKLPVFAHAPLVETVFAIAFVPIRGLTNAHLGAFWGERRDQWPIVQHDIPVPVQLETFEPRWLPGGFNLEFSSDPACRVRMFNREGSQLIQAQRDQFAFNWKRAGDGDSAYPRFEKLREQFEMYWSRWIEFVEREPDTRVKPLQWEVIYTNRVRWSEFAENAPTDWSHVLPGWDWPLSRAAVPTDGIELTPYGRKAHWLYNINGNAGRLHVLAEPGRPLNEENNNDFILQLIARGPVRDDASPLAGIDLGHTTIVSTFSRMISTDAGATWGRQ